MKKRPREKKVLSASISCLWLFHIADIGDSLMYIPFASFRTSFKHFLRWHKFFSCYFFESTIRYITKCCEFFSSVRCGAESSGFQSLFIVYKRFTIDLWQSLIRMTQLKNRFIISSCRLRATFFSFRRCAFLLHLLHNSIPVVFSLFFFLFIFKSAILKNWLTDRLKHLPHDILPFFIHLTTSIITFICLVVVVVFCC